MTQPPSSGSQPGANPHFWELALGHLRAHEIVRGAAGELGRLGGAGVGGEGSSCARLWIACSGGADSVFLVLWTLVALGDGGRERVTLLHFNHGLRGEASDGDEAFVRLMAAGLGVGVVCGRSMRAADASGAMPSEAALRAERQDFFDSATGGVGERILLLGHNRDDIIESMLMRLGRGAGTQGLSAPRPCQHFPSGLVRARPLLTHSRATLREVLAGCGVPWRDDASNATDAYLRNRLRLQVIPALDAALGGRLASGCVRSRRMLEEEEAAAEWAFRELESKACPTPAHPGDFRWLLDKPRGLVRRALWARILLPQGLGAHLEAAAVDALVDGLCSGGTACFSAGPGVRLRIVAGEVRVERDLVPLRAFEPVRLQVGEGAVLGSGLAVRLDATPIDPLDPKPGKVADNGLEQRLSDGLNLPIELRPARPDDAFVPLGFPAPVRLRDLLAKRKIPLEHRDAWPVACDAGGRIVAVPGLPPAKDACLRVGTLQGLRLTFDWSATTFPHFHHVRETSE